MNKLYRLCTQNVFFGLREANEISDGTGAQTIKLDETTGSELPLHIYPLANVIQGGSASAGGFKLTSNGYDFGSLQNTQHMGNKGNSVQDIQDISMKQAIWNYVDIQLCLWGETDRKTEFTCYIIAFNDPIYDPCINTTVTASSREANLRQNLFEEFFVKRVATNPVVRHEQVLHRDTKKAMRILWKKKYVLRETLSTEDQNKYRHVSIFRRLNKYVHYDHDYIAAGSSLQADAVDFHNASSTPDNFPHTRENLFFMITALNSAEDEQCTYDISLKSKFTTLAETAQL
jgi:hypothetical protein